MSGIETVASLRVGTGRARRAARPLGHSRTPRSRDGVVINPRRPHAVGLSGHDVMERRPATAYEISVVILTQGTRPAELDRAIASVRSQVGVSMQLVLVLNAAEPPKVEADDVVITLPDNQGIPGGRNIGAAAATAPLIMFLDDDAELLHTGILAAVVSRFRVDDRLGVMAFRLVDEDGETQRRHVPRLGDASKERSGPVTYFVGACAVVRTRAFLDVGGFDPLFFYAMEESDLSWRLLDAGWTIWYAADLRVFHPRTLPSRHHGYAVKTARNRLWMAWRSLPAPFLLAYVSIWGLAAVLRGAPATEVATGYRAAIDELPPRRPMRWRTALRMTMLGRPPVV